MPTAYIKKLAKLNNISVNTLEKFWSQAKEIAKSEGQGNSWGLITSIFQNKLKKEGYKVKASIVTSDTDELDDSDLGINVDPKEYHKQKSLQMSLKYKLDMIKKDINKEADEYNKKLEEIAKRLSEENRKRWSSDNDGDKWLYYKGTVNKEVLLKAYKDGIACEYKGFGTVKDEDIRDELNYFKNSVYPRFKKLINGSSLRVYRGLDFYDLAFSDKDLLKNYFKYLKYNLMDRNSWTTSIEVAEKYIHCSWYSVILQMDCILEDVNLPLSSWLEGYWFENENKEINLKKSLKVKNIKCVFVGEDLRKLGFKKEFNKVVAISEPDVLCSTTENKLDYINQVKECIKQIWARGTKNQQDQFAKEWVVNYSRIIDDCLNAFEEPKVCARMMYIKYHKENPQTRNSNKNKDTDFYTLLKEAKQYFEGLKKFQEDFSDFDIQPNTIKAFKEEIRTSDYGKSCKTYLYRGNVVTATSKREVLEG